MMNYLPDNILLKIFQYMPVDSRIRCERVCKKWFDLCQFTFEETHVLRSQQIATTLLQRGRAYLERVIFAFLRRTKVYECYLCEIRGLDCNFLSTLISTAEYIQQLRVICLLHIDWLGPQRFDLKTFFCLPALEALTIDTVKKLNKDYLEVICSDLDSNSPSVLTSLCLRKIKLALPTIKTICRRCQRIKKFRISPVWLDNEWALISVNLKETFEPLAELEVFMITFGREFRMLGPLIHLLCNKYRSTLRTLWLAESEYLENNHLEMLQMNLCNLVQLGIPNCHSITNQGLQYFNNNVKKEKDGLRLKIFATLDVLDNASLPRLDPNVAELVNESDIQKCEKMFWTGY